MFSLSLSMNKMEKEFVPYQQALALKELGFDEPCLKYWNGIGEYFDQKDWFNWNQSEKFVSIPLYQQAFRWFREKYGLKHDIDDDNVGTKFYYKIRSYTDKFDNYDDIIKPMREEKDWAKIEFKTYEEADLACLIKLIEIVKNK
jgi:hypothetical protein